MSIASSSSGVWSRSSSVNPFFPPPNRNVEPSDFASVEDMLFEVFRCEETDTIDSISISQFFKVKVHNWIQYRIHFVISNTFRLWKPLEFVDLIQGSKKW